MLPTSVIVITLVIANVYANRNLYEYDLKNTT